MTDSSELDALAAEYVLGTLSAEERESVSAQKALNADLDALVRDWEARLGALQEFEEAAADVPAPAGLFEKIASRIDLPGDALLRERAALRKRVRIWRAASFVSALAACFAVAFGLREAAREPAASYSALLSPGKGTPGFLLTLDARNGVLRARPIAAPIRASTYYELWQAPAGGKPHPIGPLNATGETIRRISVALAGLETSTWAVSIEPSGAPPPTAPTGPVVFSGRLTPL